jgi:predicted cupin superfamily sugar epimerase
MRLTAEQIIDLFNLVPHHTCGFVNETFRSDRQIPAEALPPSYEGSRSLGNVLCFLVTPQASVRLHRIRSDQMYHHYMGDPLEVLLIYENGRTEVKIVGSELGAGMRPQLLIPGNTFHAARISGPGSYALLGTSVWIRVEPSDVEMGDPARLMTAYPAARAEIIAFAS